MRPRRFHCQREIIRRGRVAGDDPGPGRSGVRSLQAPARRGSRPSSRSSSSTAPGSHGVLRKLAEDDAVREFALRALADRKTELDGVESAPVPRGAGRSLAPRPGAGPDRARATGGCRGGRAHHPADLAPRRLADADDEAGASPARPGPGRAAPGACGPWSRSGRSMPAWTRSTAPIARGPFAPCGRCTSRRPSRGSSRS